MAIKLKKDDSAQLTLQKFSVGLGWKVNQGYDEDFDLDVSAFMVTSSGKIPADDYLVFYNSEKRLRAYSDGSLVKPVKIVPYTEWSSNDAMREESRPTDPEISVIGSIDNTEGGTGDSETLDIDLSRVRPDVVRIVICVSIYDAIARRQNFGRVEDAYIRIYEHGKSRMGEEQIRYDLTEDFSTSRCVEFVQLRRNGSNWNVEAVGVGHHGEFDELVNKYYGN